MEYNNSMKPSTPQKKKRIRIALFSTLIPFVVICISLTCFVVFSEIPVTWLVANVLFAQKKGASWNDRTDVNGLDVVVSDEIVYNIDSPLTTQSTLNVIYPKDNSIPLPVVIFAHGGGYIAGDKNENEHYAMRIAENGYIVINMNYALAPNYKYPIPLTQLRDVWNYVHENAVQLEEELQINLDLSNIFLAGDSAGANLVSMFSLINLYPSFATDAEFISSYAPKIIVDNFDVRGLILLCGVFEFSYFSNFTGFAKFAFERIAWGITGTKDWNTNGFTNEMSLYNELEGTTFSLIDSSFPPTYITDGSEAGSFNDQALTLANILEENGVYHNLTLFPDLMHEFQFILGNVPSDSKLKSKENAIIEKSIVAAERVFSEVLDFLLYLKR